MAQIEFEQVLFQDRLNKISIYNFNNTQQLRIPTIFAGIKTNTSLKALASYEQKYNRFNNITGLVFPLESMKIIINRCKSPERRLLNRKISIGIPSTEMMWYKDEKFQQKIKDLNRRSLNLFYTNQEFLNQERRNRIPNFERWLNGLNRDYLSLILETIMLERSYASALDVPPASPILNSGDTLEISIKINQLTEQLLMPGNSRFSQTPKPVASFFNFGSQCFHTKTETNDISNKLIDYLYKAKSDCVIFKVFNESLLENKSKNLANFKLLYQDLYNFCDAEQKLLMMVDTMRLGQVLMYKGLMIYSTPLNFRTENKTYGGKSVPKERFKIWLRHYNEMTSWDDFLELVRRNNDLIPYSSFLGQNFNFNQLRSFRRNEIILFKNQLRAEALEMDCSEFHDSVMQRESRTSQIQLNNSGLASIARILF